MRPLIILVLFFNLTWAEAQLNLVPNPSFEDTLNCDSFQFHNIGYPWFTPTNCTPDYYYGLYPTCATSALQNQNGFQLPLEGIAYIGLFAAMPFNSNIGTREYISA